jgi:hypothetical protein
MIACFQTQNIHKVPTLQGHPECPGPECRKNFKGFKGAGDVEPVIAPVAPAKHECGDDGRGREHARCSSCWSGLVDSARALRSDSGAKFHCGVNDEK